MWQNLPYIWDLGNYDFHSFLMSFMPDVWTLKMLPAFTTILRRDVGCCCASHLCSHTHSLHFTSLHHYKTCQTSPNRLGFTWPLVWELSVRMIVQMTWPLVGEYYSTFLLLYACLPELLNKWWIAQWRADNWLPCSWSADVCFIIVVHMMRF